MASIKTVAAYSAEALEKIRRAKSRHPELRPLEALFRYVGDYPSKLTGNTIGLWRQQMRIAVEEVAREDPRSFSDGQIRDFIRTMDEAVDALRGRPSAPKTSSKKRKDPPKSEVVAVFGHLKTRSLALHRVRMATTALYCVLMPRLGGRPVELVGAVVTDGILTFPNAKRADGQAVERSINVRQWTMHHRVALVALIEMVSLEVQENGYEAWLSILAETLARACKMVGVSRLAPSSFRHTALSTWSAAGFSAEEIALLAGHFCKRSTSHYIRTASAWGPEDANIDVGAQAVALLADIEVKTESSTEFDFEPMPQPTAAKPDVGRSQLLQQEYRQALDEQEKTLDEAIRRALTDRGLHNEGSHGAYRPVTGRPKR